MEESIHILEVLENYVLAEHRQTKTSHLRNFTLHEGCDEDLKLSHFVCEFLFNDLVAIIVKYLFFLLYKVLVEALQVACHNLIFSFGLCRN